jgi:hypothetical protein
MALRLAFAILAHDSFPQLVRLVERLTREGDVAIIHVDKRVTEARFRELRNDIAALARTVFFATERVRCEWSEFSLVQATLNMLRELLRLGQEPDYVMLVSGADYPTKPLAQLREFLTEANGADFIEAVPMDRERWANTWLLHERFRVRHHFNVRTHNKLFVWSMGLQQKFAPARTFPNGLIPCLGSQWWTLSWRTIRRILAMAEDRKLISFFHRVWVPDEVFFQSLAFAHSENLAGGTLTFYKFTDYGVPRIFTEVHFELLKRQPRFMARKIAPQSTALRDMLDELVEGRTESVPISAAWPTSLEKEEALTSNVARKPMRNSRLLGVVTDPFWGDLKHNGRKYIVISGTSRFALAFTGDLLSRAPRLICHMGLFSRDAIGYAPQSTLRSQIPSHCTSLRDAYIASFLYEVIHSSDKVMVAGYHPDDSTAPFDRFTADPNCICALVRTSALHHFVDSYGWREESGGEAKIVGHIYSNEYTVEFIQKIESFEKEMEGRAKAAGKPLLELDLRSEADQVVSITSFLNTLSRLIPGCELSARKLWPYGTFAEAEGRIANRAELANIRRAHGLGSQLSDPVHTHFNPVAGIS